MRKILEGIPLNFASPLACVLWLCYFAHFAPSKKTPIVSMLRILGTFRGDTKGVGQSWILEWNLNRKFVPFISNSYATLVMTMNIMHTLSGFTWLFSWGALWDGYIYSQRKQTASACVACRCSRPIRPWLHSQATKATPRSKLPPTEFLPV